MNKTPHISNGNMKVGLLASFSISTKSCDMIPGPEEQNCKAHCYAKKLERLYTNTRKRYEKNFEDSMTSTFVDVMDVEIKTHKRLQASGIMRIHVAGDFYSNEYLKKWFEIIARNPNINFYGYTKSYNLDWSGKPSNLVMKLSDDKDLWPAEQSKFDGVARVYEPDQPCPKGFVPCGSQRVKGMTCAQCKMCTGKLGRKANVGFKRH